MPPALLFFLKIAFAMGVFCGSVQTVVLSCCCCCYSLQSCLTLCDPINGSPRGSPVPGILQARTLEWVAISFSNA